MTERYNGFTVILECGMTEEQAGKLMNAISMLKGVRIVEVGVSNNLSDYIARKRLSEKIRQKIEDALS